MRISWSLVALACVGCGTGPGNSRTPPPTGPVAIGLHALDAPGGALARRVLSADPRVTLVDFDPAINQLQRDNCGNAWCPAAFQVGCQWAASRGLDDYAMASLGASYLSKYVCDRNGDSSIFDKQDPPCAAGHEEAQRSTAVFTLRVYDAIRCEQVPSLSRELSADAPGAEAESKPAALDAVTAKATASS